MFKDTYQEEKARMSKILLSEGTISDKGQAAFNTYRAKGQFKRVNCHLEITEEKMAQTLSHFPNIASPKSSPASPMGKSPSRSASKPDLSVSFSEEVADQEPLSPITRRGNNPPHDPRKPYAVDLPDISPKRSSVREAIERSPSSPSMEITQQGPLNPLSPKHASRGVMMRECSEATRKAAMPDSTFRNFKKNAYISGDRFA
mmetsp:Transcript_24687/g.73431  ORF Transcript_24687/g.73431 Transcript_24687/m.73431 type:complete len:202 (-) Transcript_24687:49-654(-)